MSSLFSNSRTASDLVDQLIDLAKASDEYFESKKMPNPIVIEIAYAYEPIPTNHPEYAAQNDGLPDFPFGAMYKADARMWAQADIASIVIRAAELLFLEKGWMLKVMDCLRTVEAQAMMQNVVQENGWSKEYVGVPGYGGHPRAMAIDIVPLDANALKKIDMGSEFDHFGERSNRDFIAFSGDATKNQEIIANRKALDLAMLQAADEIGLKEKLYLYPAEWWDYRFTEDVWSAWPALNESDLPKEMRLTC